MYTCPVLEVLFNPIPGRFLSMISFHFWAICKNYQKKPSKQKLLQEASHSTYASPKEHSLGMTETKYMHSILENKSTHQFGDSIQFEDDRRENGKNSVSKDETTTQKLYVTAHCIAQ